MKLGDVIRDEATNYDLVFYATLWASWELTDAEADHFASRIDAAMERQP